MFNALYYPYADVTHSEQLLAASLYFDNIYVLEPNFFQPPRRLAQARVPGDSSMRPLIKSGVISPIGPDLLGFNQDFGPNSALLEDENIEILHASIKADLQNNKLRALAQESGIVGWDIPTGQQLFWNGLGILLELSNRDSDLPIEIEATRKDYYADLLLQANFNMIPVRGRSESRVRTARNDLEVRVPFLLGESLMTTVSLLACTELGLVPITDQRLHHEFLCQKILGSAVKQPLAETARTMELGIAESSLAITSIETQLPRLGKLSAEKVIEIRYRCRDSLKRFRSCMRKLRHSIEVNVWSDDLKAEVNKIADKEIAPSVESLRNELKSCRTKIGFEIVEDLTKAAPLPLLTTLATGCPLEIVLAASAGIVALKGLLKYFVAKSELKRNGLFFLLDFGSRVKQEA